jgi:2-oxoglutarate dehydrogenase E2 component (dihydrolipoamide succinyltransferase)
LVVPVLRDVEGMNYAAIEHALAELGEKVSHAALRIHFTSFVLLQAKSGNLAIEDMDGGTFTISNGGVFGSLMGTPIINPPQSAILGMHGIFDRPVAVKGKVCLSFLLCHPLILSSQVEIRPMMYIALTYDHRLIDGREAVTFLRKVKSGVEDPRTLLLEL